MTMANFIRKEFGSTSSWMERMSEERQLDLMKRAAAAKSDDGYVDSLLFTEFADKVTIVKKSPHFRGSKSTFKSDLSRIESLRNGLAHANDFAATRGAATKVCQSVRLMDAWIESIQKVALE
jgi:hypothetical protein